MARMTAEERREYRNRPEVKEKINKRRQTPEYKDKARKYYLEKYHGITHEKYLEMLKEQNGQCAICGNDANTSFRECLAIDHDHKTGKIRALLCQKCNQGLGLFNDNPLLLRLAEQYINKYKLKQ